MNIKYQCNNSGVVPKFSGTISDIQSGVCITINDVEECSLDQ